MAQLLYPTKPSSTNVNKNQNCTQNLTCEFSCMLEKLQYDFDNDLNIEHDFLIKLDCLPFMVNKHQYDISLCLDIIETITHFVINQQFCISDKDSGVVNLSSYNLSDTEEEVLSLGLNYCPTPKPVGIGDLDLDLEHFFRSVKLALQLDDSTITNPSGVTSANKDEMIHTGSDPLPSASCINFTKTSEVEPYSHPDLKNPSTYQPISPSHLDHVCNLISNEIIDPEYEPPNIRANMSKAHYRALSSLKNNKDIIIKPADKGRNLVIQDRSKYIEEGNRQLSDPNFYRKTEKNLTSTHCEKVSSLATKLFNEGQISKKNLQIFRHKIIQ